MQPVGACPIDSETKSVLVKDAIVILAAVGGLLAFYGVIVLVSRVAQMPLP